MTHPDIRSRIAAEMDRQGITTAELARRIGRHRTAVSRTLNSNPSRAELLLAEMLEAVTPPRVSSRRSDAAPRTSRGSSRPAES